MSEKRLLALRGAAQCLNTKEDIQTQTVALYDELLSKNNLAEEDLVSLTFSVTRDLDEKNPATALREKGRAQKTALFVTQEAHFLGSMERVIRVLVHCYCDSSCSPIPVYRNGAETLRQLSENRSLRG